VCDYDALLLAHAIAALVVHRLQLHNFAHAVKITLNTCIQKCYLYLQSKALLILAVKNTLTLCSHKQKWVYTFLMTPFT